MFFFILGYLTCPPFVHEIGHVLGAILTGGMGFPFWDYAHTIGGNRPFILLSGAGGALVLWGVAAIFFFRRHPLISAYCAGALHASIWFSKYQFDYTFFTLNVSKEMVVFGGVWAGLYWLLWVLEIVSPHYTLPWDRKRERKEVEEYLSQIDLTNPKK